MDTTFILEQTLKQFLLDKIVRTRPTAVILQPNYTAYSDVPHLATEASGRQACTLSSGGDYLEFTLAQPANALELRYSIPDSQKGGGLQTTLQLSATTMTGQPLPVMVQRHMNLSPREAQEEAERVNVDSGDAVLFLTSAYSWFYGVYPFTNIPSQGKAHHFYDEVCVVWTWLCSVGHQPSNDHQLIAVSCLCHNFKRALV